MHDIRDLILTALTVSNDATEQTIYSRTITGGAWKTRGIFRLFIGGKISSRAVLPGILTVKAKFGTITVTAFSELLNGGIAGSVFASNFDCIIIPSVNQAALSSTFVQNGGDLFITGGSRQSRANGAIDLTTDQTFSVTVQFDTADTGNIFERDVAALLTLTAE